MTYENPLKAIFRQKIYDDYAVPILESGKVYPAFLEKQADGPSYLPAAGGYSFEVIRSKAKKET